MEKIIRYLIVDTRNWWPGKQVLVSPKWIDRVSWVESRVDVHLTRAEIKNAPDFKEVEALTRGYEIKLHEHYDKQGYWLDETPSSAFPQGENWGPRSLGHSETQR